MTHKVSLALGITEIQTEFKGNVFRAFALETPQGTVLIDTCMEDDEKDFVNTVLPLRVNTIVLTHHHRDHTGALAAIAEEIAGLNIAAHRLEIDHIPVPVNLPLEHGDLVAGVLRVIHVPGHTAGNIALYLEREKILFAGDSVFGAGGYQGKLSIPPAVYSDDVEQARDSIRRMLAYPFEKAFLSHGEHLMEGAHEKISRLLQG